LRRIKGVAELKEKAMRRFLIGIFNKHGIFVEDFALCADTRRNLRKMVQERMRENGMSESYTFKISHIGF